MKWNRKWNLGGYSGDVHSEHEEFASPISYTEDPPTIHSFYGSGLLQPSYYSKPLAIGPKHIKPGSL